MFYDPHLSLCYRDLPTDERVRLACSITLLFSVVTFDEVCVVCSPNPTTTQAEVDSWRRLDSRKLARPGEFNEGQRPG